MIQSENIVDVLSALVEVQNELPTFPKGKKAFNYKYTELDTIVSGIKPIMHKYGLAFMQSVSGGENDTPMTITTRIFSKTGQYIEDSVVLPKVTLKGSNPVQEVGSAITYMKRYCLTAMLGITSDEDIDANVFDRNVQQQQKAEKQQATTPTQPQQQPQQKPKTIYADGREATAEQEARLHELVCAKRNDGIAVFTKDEMLMYLGFAKEKTAQQLIEYIENALRNRRADAPELPENKIRR